MLISDHTSESSFDATRNGEARDALTFRATRAREPRRANALARAGVATSPAATLESGPETRACRRIGCLEPVAQLGARRGREELR